MNCPRCGYQIHPRNIDQNALSHVWYGQIAKESGDAAIDVKAYCKLHFGVPILRGEDHEFRAGYDKLVKPLSYADKLDVMRWFPVSSLMKQGQFARYMQDIQNHYGNQGIVLESINAE